MYVVWSESIHDSSYEIFASMELAQAHSIHVRTCNSHKLGNTFSIYTNTHTQVLCVCNWSQV